MLSEAQHAALVAELRSERYAKAASREAAFALLHEPQEIVTTRSEPAPLSASGLFQALGAESRKAVANWPNLGPLLADIRSGDRESVRSWGAVLAAGGLITPEELEVVSAAVDATAEIEERTPEEARIIHAFLKVTGMPNRIDDGDFAKAWEETRSA